MNYRRALHAANDEADESYDKLLAARARCTRLEKENAALKERAEAAEAKLAGALKGESDQT